MNNKPHYLSDQEVANKTLASFVNGRFSNPGGVKRLKGLSAGKLLKRFFVEGKPHSFPKGNIPVQKITRAQLDALPVNENHVFRLGHSSILLKLQGEYWLIDPVFSKRASPSQHLGPKRFHQVPISAQELPPLKGIILSHNHYDHLDKQTVLSLQAKTAHFYMPLGVAAIMARWGIPEGKLTEFDWWQTLAVDDVRLTATPTQHFSGRGLKDGNASLWCSWVIALPATRIFFSGDSGYFSGFKHIGDALGPFDLVIMETGAYDRFWPSVHMRPEESFQAFIDLKGRRLLPAHNGTFDLSFHPWYEPFERIHALAMASGVELLTPRMGEPVCLDRPQQTTAWWRALMPETTRMELSVTAPETEV
ncbi:MAG: MBL fold metallo-hydrolase [Hahellaceae bacterium]|nr:MBL fold metallo-hydrolase [Hahellaceae bacterium]MCP5169769.1 MBL fold metallo-hydrolase [Hahellaceae bacterium]